MTGKARGSYEATYGYRYGGTVRSITSDFPGEGNVTYEYAADKKCRTRTQSGITTTINWGSRTRLVSKENASGDLLVTYVGATLAEITGSSPATGIASYYGQDGIRSTRSSYDHSKSQLSQFEPTPFGNVVTASGQEPTSRFAGMHWDGNTNTHKTYFRLYDSELARWLRRDPIGIADGPNRFAYVGSNPILNVDPLELQAEGGGDAGQLLVPPNCNMDGQAYLPEGEWPEGTSTPFPSSEGSSGGPPRMQRFNMDFYYGPNQTALKIPDCWNCALICDEEGNPVTANCYKRTGRNQSWYCWLFGSTQSPRGPRPDLNPDGSRNKDGDGLSWHPYPDDTPAPQTEGFPHLTP